MTSQKTVLEINRIKNEMDSLSSKMISCANQIKGDVITIRNDPLITDLWNTLCTFHKKAMLLCVGMGENKPQICAMLEKPQACVKALHLSEEAVCCEIFKRRLESKNRHNRMVEFLMSSPVITTALDSTVADVIKLMKKHDIDSVVVINKGKIKGIITEGDLISKIFSTLKDSKETLAKEIMTKEPIITIDPKTDIREAARVMSKYSVKHLPVVKNNELVGMFAGQDFYQE